MTPSPWPDPLTEHASPTAMLTVSVLPGGRVLAYAGNGPLTDDEVADAVCALQDALPKN